MNMFFKSIAALGGLALVAACDAPASNPSISAPKGASAQQALDGFAVTVGMAEGISNNCRAYGVTRNYRDSKSLIRSYVMGLVAQGYSESELTRASKNLDGKKGVARAKSYLEARGAREGDLKSLCDVGKSEIAKQSALGKLLKRV